MSELPERLMIYPNPMRSDGVFVGSVDHREESHETLDGTITRRFPKVSVSNAQIEPKLARRLVAAYNACAGIDIDDLEKWGDGSFKGRIEKAEARADEAERLLQIVFACEGGKWHPERYAQEREQVLNDVRTFLEPQS